MPSPLPDSALTVLALRCGPGGRDLRPARRAHPCFELCLVGRAAVTLLLPEGRCECQADTLVLHRRAEKHGFYPRSPLPPDSWILHFAAGAGVVERFEWLGAPRADRRWTLSARQAATLRSALLHLSNEQAGSRSLAQAAAAAQLELLLIAVERWVNRTAVTARSGEPSGGGNAEPPGDFRSELESRVTTLSARPGWRPSR